MSLNSRDFDRPVTWFALWSPAALFLLYSAGVVAAWLFQVAGYESVAQLLGGGYGHLCHQLPERSISCGGATMVICARCTGFFGSLALTSLWIVWRQSRRGLPWLWAIVLCLPMAFDAGFDLSAGYEAANGLRALTGVLAGAGLAAAFYPKFVAAIRDQLALRAAQA